jgi:hypothetical protein
MLYSNRPLRSYSKELPIGDYSPGKHLMCLPCDKGVELRAATNYAYTISFKDPSHPTICREYSEDVCLLLSAEGTPSFQYPGVIRILARHNHSPLEYKAGKCSGDGFSWTCAVIKVPKIDTVIQVQKMGSDKPQLFLVPCDKTTGIYPCTLDTLEEQCRRLNINVPCHIIKNDQGGLEPKNKLNFDPAEWIEL